MKRVVISVPRILAWIKRQPPERVIGYPGDRYLCVVSTYVEGGHTGALANFLPNEGTIAFSLFSGGEITFRRTSPAVNRLGRWFDTTFEGIFAVTAGEFLTKWQARDE